MGQARAHELYVVDPRTSARDILSKPLTVPIDIACLSFLTTISTAASITQQFHSIINWRDIALAKFERIAADPRNPELSISGASEGFDLILFYIRMSLRASSPPFSKLVGNLTRKP